MSALGGAPVKSMIEYHQRYSRGRLVHRGLEVYCRHCTRHRNVGDLGYSGARRMLLDQGWTLEDDESNSIRWWHCPNCRSPFPEEIGDDHD